MGRIRKLLIPGVDKNLLIKDATKLMPESVAAPLHRERRQPRRADAADRLRRLGQFLRR